MQACDGRQTSISYRKVHYPDLPTFTLHVQVQNHPNADVIGLKLKEGQKDGGKHGCRERGDRKEGKWEA